MEGALNEQSDPLVELKISITSCNIVEEYHPNETYYSR